MTVQFDKKDANSRKQQDSHKPGPLHSSPFQNWFQWLFLFLGIILLLSLWTPNRQIANTIPYSEFKQELEDGNVSRVVAQGETLQGDFKEPVQSGAGAQEQSHEISSFTTTRPPFEDPELMQQISAQNIEFVSEGSGDSMLWMALINLMPLLLLLVLGYFIFKNVMQRTGGMMSFGRSTAKRFDQEQSTLTFEQVAGHKETKEELKEIIEFLTRPDKFSKLGSRIPKGVLLLGPPGTGKTMLARAVAGEASVPFYSITGSDFMEMFVGVGASRVRDLFQTAKANAPCIIFIDELDSIGRRRGAGLGGGHDEREQTLNQMLSEIDGFEPTDNVVVIGATNRPDVLDHGLLRPGRFDRQITVDLPSLPERVEILQVHTQKVPLASDVDLEDIARTMPGQSGANLHNLVNEASLIAARSNKNEVSAEDFATARDKLLVGQVRGGIELAAEEKRSVSVHESGHALAAYLLPHGDPVEKVSIIPRGRALGATQQLPEERYNVNQDYLLARLKVLLAGRAAEEVLLDTISVGAADDLKQVGQLARRMVGQWGMSEKFKNIALVESDSEVFLGSQIARERLYSEDTAREIDLEIKKLLDTCYQETLELLRKHVGRLENFAKQLELRETIMGEELEYLLRGEQPPASSEEKGSEDAQGTSPDDGTAAEGRAIAT